MHITCRLCWDYVWATRQFNISTQTSGTKAFIGLQLTTLSAIGTHLFNKKLLRRQYLPGLLVQGLGGQLWPSHRCTWFRCLVVGNANAAARQAAHDSEYHNRPNKQQGYW